MLFLALRGSADPRDVELADKVMRRRIESIDGVGEVTMSAARSAAERAADPIALRLGIGDRCSLASQNLNVPGGSPRPAGTSRSASPVHHSPAQLGPASSCASRQGVRCGRGFSRVGQQENRRARRVRWREHRRAADRSSPARTRSRSSTPCRTHHRSSRAPAGGCVAPDHLRQLGRDPHLDARGARHLVLGAVLAAIIVLIFLGSGRGTDRGGHPISIVGTFAVMYLLASR